MPIQIEDRLEIRKGDKLRLSELSNLDKHNAIVMITSPRNDHCAQGVAHISRRFFRFDEQQIEYLGINWEMRACEIFLNKLIEPSNYIKNALLLSKLICFIDIHKYERFCRCGNRFRSG